MVTRRVRHLIGPSGLRSQPPDLMADYWVALGANQTAALEEERIADLRREAVREGERARALLGYANLHPNK
eukprot:1591290-Pyramimonas_sp.AAC.1